MKESIEVIRISYYVSRKEVIREYLVDRATVHKNSGPFPDLYAIECIKSSRIFAFRESGIQDPEPVSPLEIINGEVREDGYKGSGYEGSGFEFCIYSLPENRKESEDKLIAYISKTISAWKSKFVSMHSRFGEYQTARIMGRTMYPEEKIIREERTGEYTSKIYTEILEE